MKKVIYVHGKGGNAAEAEHFRKLFADCEVVGFDYKSQSPREARDEFLPFSLTKKTTPLAMICEGLYLCGAFYWLYLWQEFCIFAMNSMRVSRERFEPHKF